jgi:hypothetical protein
MVCAEPGCAYVVLDPGPLSSRSILEKKMLSRRILYSCAKKPRQCPSGRRLFHPRIFIAQECHSHWRCCGDVSVSSLLSRFNLGNLHKYVSFYIASKYSALSSIVILNELSSNERSLKCTPMRTWWGRQMIVKLLHPCLRHCAH